LDIFLVRWFLIHDLSWVPAFAGMTEEEGAGMTEEDVGMTEEGSGGMTGEEYRGLCVSL
jgi:hypothetical protein